MTEAKSRTRKTQSKEKAPAQAAQQPKGAEKDAAAASQADKKPYEPKKPGNFLFENKDVPKEMYEAAKQRFGVPGVTLQASNARENGTYKGEILQGENFLAQKVGENSVVFHKKSDITLATERLQQDPRRLNGAQIAIHYNGADGKAYPHDPQKEQLDIVAATMKKHAEKLGLGDDGKFAKALDQIKESMWGDVLQRREANREAQRQSRENKPQQRERQTPEMER